MTLRSGWLRRLYYRIGMHAAPPGTLLFFLHRRLRALTRRRLNRYISGDVFARAAFGGTPYYDIARIRRARQVDGLARSSSWGSATICSPPRHRGPASRVPRPADLCLRLIQP